jgi:hypothetical protein
MVLLFGGNGDACPAWPPSSLQGASLLRVLRHFALSRCYRPIFLQRAGLMDASGAVEAKMVFWGERMQNLALYRML